MKPLGEKKKTRKKQENLWVPRLGKEFLNVTPKAWSVKEKIDKLHFIKIKHFCSVKGPVLSSMKRTKAQATIRKYLQIKYLTKH